jgi:hypothetical protein
MNAFRCQLAESRPWKLVGGACGTNNARASAEIEPGAFGRTGTGLRKKSQRSAVWPRPTCRVLSGRSSWLKYMRRKEYPQRADWPAPAGMCARLTCSTVWTFMRLRPGHRARPFSRLGGPPLPADASTALWLPSAFAGCVHRPARGCGLELSLGLAQDRPPVSQIRFHGHPGREQTENMADGPPLDPRSAHLRDRLRRQPEPGLAERHPEAARLRRRTRAAGQARGRAPRAVGLRDRRKGPDDQEEAADEEPWLSGAVASSTLPTSRDPCGIPLKQSFSLRYSI